MKQADFDRNEIIDKDEVLKMARQAGIPFNKWGMVGCEDCEQDIDQNLVTFAKLVASAASAKAVEREREACAKLVEDPYYGEQGKECAYAIRARGEA